MPVPLIAFDARTVRPGMTGVGRRVAHMLRESIALTGELRWGVIVNDEPFVREWLTEGGRGIPSAVDFWPVAARPDAHPQTEWWLAVSLPRMLSERGAALFHGPAFLGPWWRSPVPVVVTIHDMAHCWRPRTQPWRFRLWLAWTAGRAASWASRVVVPSPAVAQALEDFHPRVRGRVTIVPGGVVVPGEKPPGERPGHLLHLGTFEPRKNHRFLLEVYGALCAEVDDPPRLVLAGSPGPSLRAVGRWLERSPWRDRVEIRLSPKDGEVDALLRDAAALVFPSHSEGQGLPVLEAMAHGKPVIAADVPGLDSFRDSPATLLPLGAVQPWTRAIRDAVGGTPNPGPARAYARRHTWRHAAEQLLSVYRDLMRK